MAARSAVLTYLMLIAFGMVGCAGESDAGRTGSIDSLPLTGKTPGGERYRLESGKPDPDDDVGSSWCLRLRYLGGVVVVGGEGEAPDALSSGAETCGPAPPPRVSGEVSADCPEQTLFIYGGAREDAKPIELVLAGGQILTAKQAELPPGSGFEGTTFLVVAGLNGLPATLREVGEPREVLFRVPARPRLCASSPGAPEGGQPTAAFASPPAE